MKKLLLGAILLTLVSVSPVTAMAEVNVGIGISLPPIVIGGPPEVVVLPDTNGVYVVPYVEVDLFFWNGWWWRPYGGGWYRSRYYDRGWGYYSRVPSFYYDVDPHWRGYYSNRHWSGRPWNYRPIPHSQLQSNWRGWQNDRYWEKQRKWDVQGYSAISNINNRDESDRNNKLSSLRNRGRNNKGNSSRSNNSDSSNINHRFSNIRGSSNPRKDSLDLRISKRRGNRNTRSLKENPRKGMQNTESRNAGSSNT